MVVTFDSSKISSSTADSNDDKSLIEFCGLARKRKKKKKTRVNKTNITKSVSSAANSDFSHDL